MKTVSEKLKRAIQSSRANRAEISRETGIDQAALSRFMSGERGLSMEAIDQLAGYFGFILTKRKGR